MLSMYLLEFVDKLERKGIDKKTIKEEILNRWDLDEALVDEIINFKNV